MITITRRQARDLRAVFRRSMFGISHRGAIPPLVLLAEGTQLRAHYRYGALAVEHVLSIGSPARETTAVSLDLLQAVAGPDETPVVLEATAPGTTLARWTDRGIPQVCTRETEPHEAAAFPDSPTTFAAAPAGLLEVLEAASRIAAEDATRYALNCLQLRGRAGQVAATDGRQLLIASGLNFPWNDDLLVPRAAIFGCPALRAGSPVTLGRTDTHVVIQAGSWTLYLEIQQDARFPQVDDALPAASAAQTWLQLAAEDVCFLAQAIDRLPGGGELDAPVTVDLNGRVVVRASAESGRATELVLSQSRYTGEPVRLATNRRYLAQAVRLGFRRLEIASAHEPVACRDEHRTYGWQPLSPESALEPSEDALRVDSASCTTPETEHPRRRHPMKHTPEPAFPVTNHAPATRGSAAAPDATATGLVSLLEEAESLYQTLSQARAQTRTLVASLRRHRRQSKLMATTLASLRQLQLQEAVR